MAFNEPKFVNGICPMKDCDRQNCAECFKYHGKWTEYRKDRNVKFNRKRS